MTNEQIYKELPTYKELYHFIFDVEKEIGNRILNPISRAIFVLNPDSFYNYEGLALLCDNLLMTMMDKPLMNGYSIRLGKNGMPSKESYANMFPANGEELKISGIEALIIIKIMIMSHLRWKFSKKQHNAYMKFLGTSKNGYRILN